MSKVKTPRFEQVIDRFIATRRFNKKSEFIRPGLRLREGHELHFEQATRTNLEHLLDADLADAEPAIPAERLFTRRNR
jgi:Arc/MetJ-type ribon-helix-helix transcriptional regulator